VDHTEVSRPVSAEDLQSTLLHLFDQTDSHSTLAQYLSQDPAGTPEVLIAFVADKMGSSQASQMGGAYSSQDQLIDLKSTLVHSRSSLTVPYLYTNGKKLSTFLVDTVSSVSPAATILSATASSSSECDSLLNTLSQSTGMYNNGRIDLVLVSFQDYVTQNVGDCVARVSERVKKATGDKYLALLSAEASNHNVQLTFPTEDQTKDLPDFRFLTSVSSHQARRTNLLAKRGLLAKVGASSDNQNTGPQYISPAILFGILLGFVLLFFFWSGVSQIIAIEAPVRFSQHKLQPSKEY